MDLSRMIADLREERDRLDRAIISLEKLSPTATPRRGRPPLSSRAANATAPQNGHNGLAHLAASRPPQD
jgi:hypothetical protein